MGRSYNGFWQELMRKKNLEEHQVNDHISMDSGEASVSVEKTMLCDSHRPDLEDVSSFPG